MELMKRQTVWWIPGSGTWGREGERKKLLEESKRFYGRD
jgi:hypothetical protein